MPTGRLPARNAPVKKPLANYRYFLPKAVVARSPGPAVVVDVQAVRVDPVHPAIINPSKDKLSNPIPENPCFKCGACCAAFQVSFYWRETDEDPQGTVPVGLTGKLNQDRCYMKGTERKDKRCIALTGEVGKQVLCTIYASRSSPCRQVSISWENGHPDEKCDKARLLWGLPALFPG